MGVLAQTMSPSGFGAEMLQTASNGGTGKRLANAVIIISGVASLAATLLSFVSIWLQTKNYRKPLLQRYVIRILLMVPIYSVASWTSIVSLKAAFWIDPIRDIYEAFTIYTFFQLLINFLGGERALIIMMHGRAPVHHLWPLNHCLPKVDISDPHTFLAIKRGILQYTWLKPVLSLATIIMKATNSYQEGYIGLRSGYFWSGLVYNVSVTLSLYSLGMFWACMSHDLRPFRPVPKFLCIKLIIFASYWQGFFLSILVWLGAIPDNVEDYTPDNLAAAIQDALICIELPAFAIAHWYAFSWHDYADITISSARMPVKYAFRDAFGPRDLIEDTKETFGGQNYGYRSFDTGDNILAHAESGSRVARLMEGMRYERGGKGKYWIPRPGQINSRTPLLGKTRPGGPRSASRSMVSPHGVDGDAASMEVEDAQLDPEDETLYTNARALEFGDWHYPVITANEPSRERWLLAQPSLVTTSANRNLIQPTSDYHARRESNIKQLLTKGKGRDESSATQNGESVSRAPMLNGMLRKHSSSSSAKSDRSQLVDLVVEDSDAEETERVRARKEGGPAWNELEPKLFVRTYPDSDQGEEIRAGFDPSEVPPLQNQGESAFAIQDEDEDDDSSAQDDEGEDSDEARQWKQTRPQTDMQTRNTHYGSFYDERNAWGNVSEHDD
ncbi:DUF300-domain-containing protein [Xylona heveae TC161]|uniref:DUF300-domain-containing protein n=1 Tax=Xylona heveae (strain CBS 132557 / TC161) TaxID=1328760 RepID=A0A165HFZ1_XYLHT|nr:DUF300-domain-containing protein [Xylona heveae TC161]KZF23453.1 DUF300-domain-containing protein [Xylona heveae TC161]